MSEDRFLNQFLNFDISFKPAKIIEPIIPPCSNMPCIEDNLNSRGDIEKQNDRRMLVYSKKLKAKENLTSEAPRELEPMIAPDVHKSYEPKHSNIDLLIVLKKQTRSCTLYPISKFISYKALSTDFHTLHLTLTVQRFLGVFKKH